MPEKTEASPAGEGAPQVDVTLAQDGGILKQIKRAGSDPGETSTLSYRITELYRVTMVADFDSTQPNH